MQAAPGVAIVLSFVEVAAVIPAAVILSILKGVALAVTMIQVLRGAAPGYSRCSD